MKRMLKTITIIICFILVLPFCSLADELKDALTLNNEAFELYEARKYAEAEPLYKRSLAIWEKALGGNHHNVAASLNNLASLYISTGRYAEAEPLFKRSLAIREKALGGNHPDVAQSLNNLGLLYSMTGRYVEAEPLYKRSLAIREKALGENHPSIAKGLNNLAGLYKSTGRYAEAEPLYKRSLAIWEKALGENHPDVAKGLNSLAGLYDSTGRYAEAEPHYKRSLAIWEKALGENHPDVAAGLNNLASLYISTGRYAEAEPLYKRSLAIREKALGENHPDVARGLNGLAVLYESTGRYAEAEPLYKRSLAIREKALGENHPDVAISLNNLASLYKSTGRYAEAEPLYKRSLAIREKALGENHPDVARGLNGLASLYISTGRYAETEPLYKRSLAIWEKALGENHPDVAVGLHNLAVLHAKTGLHTESHALLRRGFAIGDRNREEVFILLSDRQKFKYMNQNEYKVHMFLTHTALYLQDNPTAVQETLDAWLRWKGAVMEAQGRQMEALSNASAPKVRETFLEHKQIRLELARMQLSGPGNMTPETYRKRIGELTGKKEYLEAILSRLSADFALEKTAGRADTKSIANILPEKSIYIDFVRLKFFDFKGMKWGTPHYLAFALIPGNDPEVKLLDLGEAETIDRHIRDYRKEMNRVNASGKPPDQGILHREAAALYGLVMKPVEPLLRGKRHLFISPDGELSLASFEALITPGEKYLVEDYLVSYVGAGRDIVRFTDKSLPGEESLIMADPDYNMGLHDKNMVVASLGVAGRTRSAVSRDASNLNFTPLPDTRREAEGVAKILHGKQHSVKIRMGQEAVEEVLFHTEKPKMLHIATHGYFLKDEEIAVTDAETRGISIVGNDDFRKQPVLHIENPMLRSGIVLAGANASLKEGRDDGMVSAEKIFGLNLRGTDLVVLSACETGVGDVKSGEGVFGLKRAFILSGAKTLVMSLWNVPSAETTELMTAFYGLMSKRKPKAEALREAKLEMMKKRPNPFYWGAFVLNGKPD